MLFIIITTYKEPKTLKKSLDIILNEIKKISKQLTHHRLAQGSLPLGGYEILVIGPDKETEKVVKKYNKTLQQVQGINLKYLKDQGKGKPAALNLAFKNLSNRIDPGFLSRSTIDDILILTDGDVWPSEGFLKKLLESFNKANGVSSETQIKGGKKSVGAVTGRPISISSRNTIFGFWSHLLTDAAHQRRLKLSRAEKYLDCSGYLYAIRRLPITNYQLPITLLSEDNYISQLIWQNGYKIDYAPEAKVYVKYPDNFKDWILQKRRSTGGYKQNLKLKIQNSKVKKGEMRNFFKEVFHGTFFALTYPKNLREFWWTILLFWARLYLWFLIFWDHKILRKKFGQSWGRVESTK